MKFCQILPKSEIKILNKKWFWSGFQLPKVWPQKKKKKKKEYKSPDSLYYGFHSVAKKNTDGWLNICTLFLGFIARYG